MKNVENIEVSGNNILLRGIITGVLVLIAAISLTFTINTLINGSEGWREITVATPAEGSCAGDLTLSYEFNVNIALENRQLTKLYTELCEREGRVFDAYNTYNGVKNLAALNQNPNATVELEPELCAALELLDGADCRLAFLAPVYHEYEGVFRALSDEEAAYFDQKRNADEAQYISDICDLINGGVSLELLGGNSAVLHVSEEYLSFAEENGVEAFVDLYWMKNAFIMDYIAEKLRAEGFTRAILSGVDGYLINLDESGREYAVSIYERIGGRVEETGTLAYSKPLCAVRYRDFTLENSLLDFFYPRPDGSFATPYIDLDGAEKCGFTELFCGSYEAGCAETVVKTAAAFMSGDVEALNKAAGESVFSLWSEGGELRSAGDLGNFKGLPSK